MCNYKDEYGQDSPFFSDFFSICSFHSPTSICDHGMVYVSPDGTTDICRIDQDETNLEVEEEFVFDGVGSVDRLHAHCTVRFNLALSVAALVDFFSFFF